MRPQDSDRNLVVARFVQRLVGFANVANDDDAVTFLDKQHRLLGRDKPAGGFGHERYPWVLSDNAPNVLGLVMKNFGL